MANWATTHYVLEGPKEILEKINKAIEHPIVQEGSDETWEGNVLNTLDIKWESKKPDGTGYYMRGFITESELNDVLTIYAEEAWGLTDFYEALEEAFPEIKVYYYVEEVDCDVFATNDANGKYFVDRCYVDMCFGGEYDSEYFTNEKEMYEWLDKNTNGKVKSAEDAEKFNNDSEKQCLEDFISIHVIDVIE